MKKYTFKKIGITLVSILAVVYLGFLALPIVLNGVIKSYVPEINKLVKETTGLSSEIEGVKLVTTPKLTAGIDVGLVKLSNATDNILDVKNAKVRLSLLPILLRKIEIDKVEAESFYTNIRVEKNGSLELLNDLEKITSKPEDISTQDIQATAVEIPFGIKLSNKLPNIKLGNYNIVFTDIPTNKVYEIVGERFAITDFVFNRKVDIQTVGKIDLEGQNQFNYDVKIFNRIMPNMDLHSLVFAPQVKNETVSEEVAPINVIDLFKAIKSNKITADLNCDLKTAIHNGDIHIDGGTRIDNMTIAVDGISLPASFVDVVFKRNEIDLNSNLYSSKNDKTEVLGKFKTGKKPNMDLTFRSNAKFNDLINLIDSVAQSVGFNTLRTLSASGGIDADFNLKSDFKKVISNGYFNVKNSNLKYGLYNVAIDNINANIDFSDNQVKITDSGFEVLAQPLKFYGEIKQDATADLHLIADKLPIKGLILAFGQVALLKDNNIKSGSISLDASVLGKLTSPDMKLNISADSIDIINVPSDTRIVNESSTIALLPSNNAFTGDINVKDLRVINPLATISLPQGVVNVNEKDIALKESYLMFNNSKINYGGKIANYMTQKLTLDIFAKGNILASDIKSMIPQGLLPDITAKGAIPLSASVTGDLKSQFVKVELKSDAQNNISLLNIENLKGQTTLINGEIKIADNSLKIQNTGIYKNDISHPLVTLKGSVDNLLGQMTLNNINIKTLENISIEIPYFKNSKATALANITVNGNVMNPFIVGSIDVPNVSIPTLKTTVKHTKINIDGKNLIANCPDIVIDNSKMNGDAKVSMDFSKGIYIPSLTFNAENIDVDTLAGAMMNLPQPAPTSGVSTSPTSTSTPDLGITLANGKGNISKLKSGGIVASDLSSDFYLKNNTLYLNNIKGKAFEGDILGKVSYNIITSAIGVDMTGTNLNATSAIEGAAGIKNALSGRLKFGADIKLKGLTEKEMMESLSGKVTFGIGEGSLGSIGKLDTFIGAQNVTSNSILKSAINSIALLPTIQKTANFKSIDGEIDLAKGWADLKSVTLSGPAMCYHVSGKYNLLSGDTKITVLGRLSADVVAALGPLGELSVSKLTSYIPKFGALTDSILNSLTTPPSGEKVHLIPNLSNGDTNYKDFKVLIDGNIASPSAVKYFKWLSVCDTSEIETINIKEQVQTTQKAIKETYSNTVQETKNAIEAAKQEAKNQAEQLKNLKNNFGNILKSF